MADDQTLSKTIKILVSVGISLILWLLPTDSDHLPAAGHLAGPAPTDEQLEEARFGLTQAREIARLDIGQSIIVHGKCVVCVEAFKGTNECLHAGGHRDYPVTLCKVTKPGHDMRPSFHEK